MCPYLRSGPLTQPKALSEKAFSSKETDSTLKISKVRKGGSPPLKLKRPPTHRKRLKSKSLKG
jgi:hypothetical protein